MSKKQKTLFQAWSQVASKKAIPVDHNVQDQILTNGNAANAFQNSANFDNIYEDDNIECLPGFDMEAGKTWIFPTNYPVRDYQFSIVKECLFKNTMVVLPTGLGKTFIAAVVMYNLYRWYPDGKVVFMAPTRPLVAQQQDACFQITGISPDDTVQMTGTNAPAERKQGWMKKRVFFLTPQTLSNDLARNICPSEKIRCLVVDEAHKALGNHAYCEVVRLLISHSSQFRILALTATPGSDTQAVKQVISNLLISHVEMRTEDSEDIQPYTHARNIEKIIVPLDNELSFLKNNFLDIINIYMKRLVQRKACSPKNPALLSKFQIIKLREIFCKCPPQGIDKRSNGLILADFALCISLYHAYELLLHHGIKPFYQFLMGVLDGDKSIPHARSELKKNLDFEKMMAFVKDHYFPENSTAPTKVLNNGQSGFSSQSTSGVQSFVAGHPKLKKLEKVVLDHFQGEETDIAQTRIIIFSQYRDSVKEIEEMLKRHHPIIKIMSFLGQATKTGSAKGVSQKQQLKVIQDFRAGEYNTLVSTCVGEEGLDIGEVDLIICYDCIKSPIRLVQRIGRTGRKRKGRIVMLITEGKEEQMYNSSERQKKSIFRAIRTGFSFAEFYQNNPRMVPRGLYPACVKTVMKIESKIIARTKKPSKSEEKLSGLLNDHEKLYFDHNFKVSESEISVLPTTTFLTLPVKGNVIEKAKSSSKELSLTNWLPWQSMLHKTYKISHSTKTSTLVDIFHFINHPETLPNYESDSHNRSKPQANITKKSKSLNSFLTGVKSKPEKHCNVINSTKSEENIVNIAASCIDEDAMILGTVEIESPTEVLEQMHKEDFLTFISSMIIESEFAETTENGKSTIVQTEPLLDDFSFLCDSNYLKTSFQSMKNISCNNPPHKSSPSCTVSMKWKASICEEIGQKLDGERYNMLLDKLLSDNKNFSSKKTPPSCQNVKQKFQQHQVQSSVQNHHSEAFSDFVIPVPNKSLQKSKPANLSKKCNSPSNYCPTVTNSFVTLTPKINSKCFLSATDSDDRLKKINAEGNKTTSYSVQPIRNPIDHKSLDYDSEVFDNTPLFADDNLNELTTLKLIENSDLPANISIPERNQTSNVNRNSPYNFVEPMVKACVKTTKSNVVLGEKIDINPKETTVKMQGPNQIWSNSETSTISEVPQLNMTTQCSLTQLASLIDSTPKLTSLMEDKEVEIRTNDTACLECDDEEEICPTPPEDIAGSSMLFSYRSSQLKAASSSGNTSKPLDTSNNKHTHFDNNSYDLLKESESLIFSPLRTVSESNKELRNDVSKDTNCIVMSSVSEDTKFDVTDSTYEDTKRVVAYSVSEDTKFDVTNTTYEDTKFDVTNTTYEDTKFDVTNTTYEDTKCIVTNSVSEDIKFNVTNTTYEDTKCVVINSKNEDTKCVVTNSKREDTKCVKTNDASKNTKSIITNSVNINTKCDSTEKMLFTQLQSITDLGKQNTPFVQTETHDLDVAFDLSFDVDFSQENFLPPPVKSPVKPFAIKSSKSKLSLRQKSKSKTQFKQTNNLKRTSTQAAPASNLEDESSDDDFKIPKRPKIKNNSTKKQFKVPKSMNTAQTNKYILQEAEVADENVSEDESEDSDLDQLDESFIDNNTVFQNQTTELGLYLASVKNCRGPQPRYKLKFNHSITDVFSQPVNETATDYMLDSFCVSNDNVTFLSSSDTETPEKKIKKNLKKKKKRKRIVLEDSNSSNDDKTPHKYRKIEASSSHHKETKMVEKSKIYPKLDSKADDNCSRDISQIIKRNKSANTPPPPPPPNVYVEQELQRKSLKDDTTHATIQTKTEGSFEDFNNISFDVSWDEPIETINIPKQVNNLNNISITNKCANVEKEIISMVDGDSSECIPNIPLSMNQSKPKCNELARESRISQNDHLDIGTLNATDTEIGHSGLPDLNECIINDNGFSHNSKFTNSTSNLVILVSTRELPSSKMIFNFLRTNHSAIIIVMQLPETDYIVSNRLAVLRIYDSDFSTIQNAAKVVKKVKATKELYEKCCVIIEKDSRKSLFVFQKDSKSHLEFSLTIIQHSSIKILHSGSQTESAKLLYELAEGEQKRNMHINVPVNLTKHQQQLYNFYTSLPHISPICALNFMYRFPTLHNFFQSSKEELKEAGYISTSKAHSIHWYLRANLQI